MENENKTYIAYEYKDVTVSKKNESFWEDGYQTLGWEIEKTEPAVEKRAIGAIRLMAAPLSLIPGLGSPFKKMLSDHDSQSKTQIRMKRKRKMDNKMQLNRIQLEFEQGAKELDELENSRTTGAAIAAVAIGLLGTVFMGGSMFAYLDGLLVLSAGLAVPGFIGWIAAVLVYYYMKGKRDQKVDRLINEKQEGMEPLFQEACELIS